MDLGGIVGFHPGGVGSPADCVCSRSGFVEGWGAALTASLLAVMRTQGSLRLILNTKLWAQMQMDKASEKSIRITAMDTEDQGVKVFLISVSSPRGGLGCPRPLGEQSCPDSPRTRAGQPHAQHSEPCTEDLAGESRRPPGSGWPGRRLCGPLGRTGPGPGGASVCCPRVCRGERSGCSPVQPGSWGIPLHHITSTEEGSPHEAL